MDDDKVLNGGGGGESPADRVARAEDVWTKSGEEEPAKPAAVEAGGEGKPAVVAEPGKPAEGAKPPVDAAGEDAKLAYFNEPRFQEIYKERNDFKGQLDAHIKVLSEGPRSIPDVETLRGVRDDAFLLYDIAEGKKGAADLLNLFKANWEPEQFKTVLGQLKDYVESQGIKVAEGAAAEDPNKDKPWFKDISDLRKTVETREQQEAATKLEGERMKTVESVITEVTKLCKAAGVEEKEDVDDYCLELTRQIGGQKKLLEQLEKGQFGELQRLFTEYHNKLVARAKRYGDKVLTAKQAKDKVIPRVPAGGSGPAPPADRPAKRDLATSDGRIDAANKEWEKTAGA